MPRRSDKPQTDEGMFVPYTNSEALVAPAWFDSVPIPSAERNRSIDTLRNLHHRVNNSPIDPLSVAHVVDTLQRWSPAYYIRSRYIVNRLNSSQSAISFETIQVGRIMGELTEVAKEAYAEYPDLTPIVMRMDYRGNAWFINSHPGTYKWLWKLRKQLIAMAQEDIANGPYSERPRLKQGRASLYTDMDLSPELD